MRLHTLVMLVSLLGFVTALGGFGPPLVTVSASLAATLLASRVHLRRVSNRRSRGVLTDASLAEAVWCPKPIGRRPPFAHPCAARAHSPSPVRAQRLQPHDVADRLTYEGR